MRGVLSYVRTNLLQSLIELDKCYHMPSMGHEKGTLSFSSDGDIWDEDSICVHICIHLVNKNRKDRKGRASKGYSSSKLTSKAWSHQSCTIQFQTQRWEFKINLAELQGIRYHANDRSPREHDHFLFELSHPPSPATQELTMLRIILVFVYAVTNYITSLPSKSPGTF